MKSNDELQFEIRTHVRKEVIDQVVNAVIRPSADALIYFPVKRPLSQMRDSPWMNFISRIRRAEGESLS
jgi:hypothetical protein